MTATTEEKNPDESTWDPKLGIYIIKKKLLYTISIFLHMDGTKVLKGR
jgi:hypothetical protein